MQTNSTTRRDLFRSSSEVLVLSILTDGPTHGYAIQRELKRTLSQTLSASSLYPLLGELEAQGHIASTPTTHNGRPRKVYHLTAHGQQHLRSDQVDLLPEIGRARLDLLRQRIAIPRRTTLL